MFLLYVANFLIINSFFYLHFNYMFNEIEKLIKNTINISNKTSNIGSKNNYLFSKYNKISGADIYTSNKNEFSIVVKSSKVANFEFNSLLSDIILCSYGKQIFISNLDDTNTELLGVICGLDFDKNNDISIKYKSYRINEGLKFNHPNNSKVYIL